MVFRVSHEWKMSVNDVYAMDYNLFCHHVAFLGRMEERVEKVDFYLCRLMALVGSLWSSKSYAPKDFLIGETPGDTLNAKECPEETLFAALRSVLGDGLTQEEIDSLPAHEKDRTNG